MGGRIGTELEKKLSLEEAKRIVLEQIVKKRIIEISYYHPETDGILVDDNLDLTKEALRALDSENILTFNPRLTFGMWPYFWKFGSRCGYRVDTKKAEEAYKSKKVNPMRT